MVIANTPRAWLHLVPLIPSIVATIFDLYHFLGNQALRTAVNNHVIILLLSFGLLMEVTSIPWSIYYYFTGTSASSTPAFCLAWVFLDTPMTALISILMAWASIERHILVFYPNLLATKKKCFFFHYLPLAICILWPLIFYIVMFFIVPCNFPFYFNRRQCARYSCIILIPKVALMDSITNYILPAFVIAIFSVTLIVRVIYKRYRFRGRIDWRNYWKMSAQLLPISALYIALQVPIMILYAAYSGGLPRTVATDFYSDGLFFSYWIMLLTPFASAVALPDLKTKFRNAFLFWRRRNAVQPVMFEMARRNIDRTVAMVPVVQ